MLERQTPRLRDQLYRFGDAGYKLWSISNTEIAPCPFEWLRDTDDLWAVHGIRDVAVVPTERTELAAPGMAVQ